MAWRGGALLVAHEVTGRKHQSLGLLNKVLFYYSSTCNQLEVEGELYPRGDASKPRSAGSEEGFPSGRRETDAV